MKVTHQHTLHIKNGRLLDPKQKLDKVADLFIENDRIVAIETAPAGFKAEETIDAQGKLVIPGLVDRLAFLAEPGFAQKGNIRSETQAAARSGITMLCSAPDTKPVVDSAAVSKMIVEKAKEAGFTQVKPLGALTAGLEGEQLSNMNSLKEAGCIALAQLDYAFKDSHVIKQCYHYAAGMNIPVIVTPLDQALAQSGNMHEGATSSQLGLAGVAESAETCALATHLILAKETGIQLHFSRITSANALSMIESAQADGISVTADVALGNLVFTDQDSYGYDSLMHVKPVYRSDKDRDALLDGVERGVLAICSNHRPHEIAAKMAPFAASEAGISSLDSFTSVLLDLVKQGKLSLESAIASVTHIPAQQLGLACGTLALEHEASLAIIDLEATNKNETLYSQGRNNPWLNKPLSGDVVCTIKQGKIVYQA
ncbi:amidohydrolase family protein [Bermanella marisrubri]|uniref:Dihydroorotase and related cyclic amidoHydrolase n=1 Tax=Bermanella marisrubri TaxID=207949 RepID=Q1MZ17_9GAMM|nr:amidohydrolase family protein [Bermanella marisrubri]EAT11211.1 Dihydroorotase and related cyclic amidoHydrolase [Oceanobacter sp. RED65] [Bermanella marisrubri]QIZ85654.1 amidohydrolase family protein [Bermanella marisrubri]